MIGCQRIDILGVDHGNRVRLIGCIPCGKVGCNCITGVIHFDINTLFFRILLGHFFHLALDFHLGVEDRDRSAFAGNFRFFAAVRCTGSLFRYAAGSFFRCAGSLFRRAAGSLFHCAGALGALCTHGALTGRLCILALFAGASAASARCQSHSKDTG